MGRIDTSHVDSAAAIAERLLLAREQSGISQRQVAFAVGVTPAYLSRLENGQRIPSLQVIEKLAKLYRVDRGWLAKGVAGDNAQLRHAIGTTRELRAELERSKFEGRVLEDLDVVIDAAEQLLEGRGG